MSPFIIGVFLCNISMSPRYIDGSIDPDNTTTTGDSVQRANFNTFQIITADTTITPNVRPWYKIYKKS